MNRPKMKVVPMSQAQRVRLLAPLRQQHLEVRVGHSSKGSLCTRKVYIILETQHRIKESEEIKSLMCV